MINKNQISYKEQHNAYKSLYTLTFFNYIIR